jgi:hypothetical protein
MSIILIMARGNCARTAGAGGQNKKTTSKNHITMTAARSTLYLVESAHESHLAERHGSRHARPRAVHQPELHQIHFNFN